ncbi:RHS repeat domain-containing protein, partial [Thiohalomonas denitrificans]|uniref:RHS repeat domain-containing protein n=1 Tax=Thiohalomonas denitrificans TaxID=415747 RepID=UPI0026F224C4
VSHYGYDDAGQRVIKQSRQNLTVYVNQYFTERNGSIGSKHIFVGNSRIVTKVTGGTSFIRSYDGVTDAKTPPGQEKKSDNPQEKSNNGKALGKDKNTEKTNNGKALGKDKEKNNNGKSPGKDKNTKAKTKGNFKQGSHPGQGVDNRSDRANEVAMNTCKNKHLIEEHCDEDGNGIPDSQEDGSDGGIEDGTIGDNTDGTEEEIVTLGSNGEQLFYYHPDHLGSTGYVTRENGEVHEHIQYFPFGETWVQQGGNTEKSPYLFTAKELDEATGLYYFGARYYDPRTSVWQSADPIIGKYLDGAVNGVYEPSNLAFYTYGRNNPVILKDPDGNIVPLLIGAWMVVEAGLTAYDVYTAGDTLLDENASTTDKAIAVGGVVLGAIAPGGGYGTAGRMGAEAVEQTAKAANRVENAEEMTTLYRAVGPDELVDIENTGQFVNRGSAEGKYFTTSSEHASDYAKQAVNAFGDAPYTTVSTQVPKSSLPSPVSVDGGIPAYVVPDNALPGLKPEVLDSMAIP